MNYPPISSSISGCVITPVYSPISQEIHNLVVKYRQGDTASGLELIQRFQPLIRKYKRAIWFGRLPKYDRELGRFFSFFNKDRQKGAELLSKSIRRDDAEDLDQLLSFCLLQTAQKYSTISAGYKFVVKENLVKLTKDVANHRTTIALNMAMLNDYMSPTGSYSNIVNAKTSKGESAFTITMATGYQDSSTIIDEFVVQGSDCAGFDTFSLEERNICKLLFIEGHDRAHAAKLLNITERQIRRKVGKIRDKLRAAYPHITDVK